MNFNAPLVYDNVAQQNRRRAQTMQTTFRLTDDKPGAPSFIIQKYFQSRGDPMIETIERANYANVGPLNESIIDEHLVVPLPHKYMPSNRSSHHNHMHHRSQSQHYYHTMGGQANESNHHNNYYNLSNMGTTVVTARARHTSPINGPPPLHNRVAPLDTITVMQVCNELGYHLDSAPRMPPPRNYSISKDRRSKIAFPQQRYVKTQFTDPITNVTLQPDAPITVLGPSKDDRSKFEVCYNNYHLDMPHQWTAT